MSTTKTIAASAIAAVIAVMSVAVPAEAGGKKRFAKRLVIGVVSHAHGHGHKHQHCYWHHGHQHEHCYWHSGHGH